MEAEEKRPPKQELDIMFDSYFYGYCFSIIILSSLKNLFFMFIKIKNQIWFFFSSLFYKGEFNFQNKNQTTQVLKNTHFPFELEQIINNTPIS